MKALVHIAAYADARNPAAAKVSSTGKNTQVQCLPTASALPLEKSGSRHVHWQLPA